MCPTGSIAGVQTKENPETRTDEGEDEDTRGKAERIVYKVPCGECDAVYVGETKRTLKVRLSEHRQAVKSGNTNNGLRFMFRTLTTQLIGKEPQWRRE